MLKINACIFNLNHLHKKVFLEPGFGLIEALIAALLFSIAGMGLLNYQQSLLQALKNQHEYREIVLLTHQYLNLYQEKSIESAEGSLLTWPDSWQIRLENESFSNNCVKLTVYAEKSTIQNKPKEISLTRIFCD